MRHKNNKVIAGTPVTAQQLPRNVAILNPATGTPVFGIFPCIELPEVTFRGGPIYLRFGKHLGPNRGWGLEHIWLSRFPRVLDLATAKPLVTSLVCGILKPGAAIHYEAELGARAVRSSVFRSINGVVIVEERADGKNDVFYSVVTAIPTRNVHGYQIGSLK